MDSTVSVSMNSSESSTTTQTPFIIATDQTTEPMPSGESLSTMALVEIILGCVIIALFLATLALWVYLCYKARAIRRARSVHLQDINHPIYEHISNLKVDSGSDPPLPELLSFYRNPAYVLQRSQPETEVRPTSELMAPKRPQLRHEWLI